MLPKLELWRALDRFEDELYIQSDMAFFGRLPSPWWHEGIRDAARAVAREEGLGEEQVVRELITDAYGRERHPHDEWFPHSAKRVASALPRQLEPLDPEVIERERSKGIRWSDLDNLRAPDPEEMEYDEPRDDKFGVFAVPRIIEPRVPDSSDD